MEISKNEMSRVYKTTLKPLTAKGEYLAQDSGQ
jgi:hypothetical protein